MKKLSLLFIIIVSCIASFAQTIADGEYLIKINQTGKYFAIAGANRDNGAWAIQWENEYKSHFYFIIKHLGNNVYSIKSKNSGKYLSTEGDPKAGAKLIQWDWLNQNNQKWNILPQNGTTGYVLSCYQNKMKVVLQHWNSGVTVGNGGYFFLQGDMNMLPMLLDFKKNETDQIEGNQYKNIPTSKTVNPKADNGAIKLIRDVPDGIYKIYINQSRKYLAIAGQEDMNNGMRLIQWDMLPRNNHLFDVRKLDNGSYAIMPVHSQKVLDVVDMLTDDGTQVQQWDNLNGANQQWKFYNEKDGVSIVSVASGKKLQLSAGAGNNSNGTPFIITNGATQTFQLYPARAIKFTDVIIIRDLHITTPKYGGDQQIFGNITVDIINKYGQSKGSYYFSETNDLFDAMENKAFDIGKTGILKIPGEFKFKMSSEELIGAKMIVTYGINENDASVFTSFGAQRSVSLDPAAVWNPVTTPVVTGGADDFYIIKNSFKDCLKSKLSPGKNSNSQTFLLTDISSTCQVHINMQDEDGSDNWLNIYFAITRERK